MTLYRVNLAWLDRCPLGEPLYKTRQKLILRELITGWSLSFRQVLQEL